MTLCHMLSALSSYYTNCFALFILRLQQSPSLLTFHTVSFDLENLKYVLLYQCPGMPIPNFNFLKSIICFFPVQCKTSCSIQKAVQMVPIFIAMDKNFCSLLILSKNCFGCSNDTNPIWQVPYTTFRAVPILVSNSRRYSLSENDSPHQGVREFKRFP